MAEGAERLPAWPLAALVLGSSLLAFGPLLVRLADVAPVASAFWRMALAAPVLVAFGLWRRPGPLAGLPWGLGLAAGAFFAADLAVWHLGIVRTTTANATLFANTTAFMLAGWGLLVLRERADWGRLGPLLVAAVGAALLLGQSARVSPENLLGDGLSLAAAAFYTGYLLVIMRMRGRFPTATVIALATLSAAALLLPAALVAGGPFWPRDWTPVVALALSSQLAGQGLMVFASGRLPASVLGIGLLIQPIVSALAGMVAFGERLSLLELTGAGMILVALLLVRR
ncbi:MAG: DMT family transporter [Sphingomonadaceae bacterium]